MSDLHLGPSTARPGVDPAPDDRPGHTSRLHLPALDGLRGVAILLVLVYHLARHAVEGPSTLTGMVLYKVARCGWIGVDLFFVLSGFLITGILYDTRENNHYFRNFYVRRCLRIFPLYFAVLAVVLVLLPRLYPGHRGLLTLVRDQVWYWTYTTNVMVALDGWPKFGMLGHFWSLAVEEQFYLVWPLVIFLLSRQQLMALCAGCVVLSLCVRFGLYAMGDPLAAVVLMPGRIDALAAGGFVALVARGLTGLVPHRRLAWWVGGAAGAALGAMAAAGRGLDQGDTAVVTIGYTLLAVLFASLLLQVLITERNRHLGRLAGHPGLAFFGRYSYGLYVFHVPLLTVTTPSVVAAALPWLPRGEPAPRPLFAVAVAALALGLAVLSWHLFERHFLRLKDRFPYDGPRAAAGTQ